jgi:hypothetical protein
VSPTILLQNLTVDGTVIEDAIIDMVETYTLKGYFQDCSIDIERNEAITCTTAFLSAETLEPNPDTRKPKPRTMETLYEDLAEDSDDGMLEDEEELEIINEWECCQRYGEDIYEQIPQRRIKRKNRIKFLNKKPSSAKRRYKGSKDQQSEQAAKKRKINMPPTTMSTRSRECDGQVCFDIFEGGVVGNFL